MSPKLSPRDACGGAATHHHRSLPEPVTTCRGLAARLVLIFNGSVTYADLEDAYDTAELLQAIVASEMRKRMVDETRPLSLRLSE